MAVFATLALPNRDAAPYWVDVAPAQTYNFADAHAGGIHEAEENLVAKRDGRFEERLHLSRREHHRQRSSSALGFIGVLHTWGQSLEHHPHIHCLVPGGGLTSDGAAWVNCRNNFLLPIRVMRSLFRGKLLAFLRDAYHEGELTLRGRLQHLRDPLAFARLLRPLTKTKWVVYAKPPFAGAEQVLKYLARYTHRVAISNRRLVAMEHGHVTFKWKDYRDGQKKLMRVGAHEFLRRLLLHVLPRGFMRIRHFGILANRGRKQALAQARALIAAEPPPRTVKRQEELVLSSSIPAPFTCPRCHRGTLLLIGRLTAESTSSQQGWDTS